MFNHGSLLVLIPLWFWEHVLSQSPVCLWGTIASHTADIFDVSAMNGLYTPNGSAHDGKPYYTKSEGTCYKKYYMYYVEDPRKDWQIHTSLHETIDWAHCHPTNTHDITSCSEWEIWDSLLPTGGNYKLDPNIFTTLDACPSWSCDHISIPSLPNGCNGTFDEYLGNNIWKNSLNNLYWYFNSLYFRWECHYESPYPDFCTDNEPLAYTVPGWIINNNTVSLEFRIINVYGTQSYDVNCMASTSPTSSPSRNPSTPPSVFPTTGTPTDHPSDHPSDQPSNHPSVPPTYQPSKNHSGTFVNITVMVNGSISIDDVIQTVNQTVFTYLIAQRIPIPLETDIITRGTTITAVYVFSNGLDTDDMNANDMEEQISNELEDTYQGNVKVKVTLNTGTDDKDSAKDNDTIAWILFGVGVFAVCVIVTICCWFRRRQRSYFEAAVDAIEIANVQPMQTTRGDEDINTAMGSDGSVLLVSDSNAASVSNVQDLIEMNDSDGEHDDLYVKPSTTGGDTMGNDEEEEDEDLDHMYDKAHKTATAGAVQGDGEVDPIEMEDGEDSDEDTDEMRCM
eukprot:723943_1